MAYPLGTSTIVAGVQGTITVVNSGIQGLIIGNESGYEVSVTLEGSGISKTLYPGTADFFPYHRGFSGVVTWNTVTSLANVRNYPGKSITFDAVGITDNFDSTSYPMSIAAVQAVSPTASGKPIFTAQIGFASTATTQQGLNIFNPATSGVVATFHSARGFTTDASSNILLVTTSGADKNLAHAVSADSNNDQSGPTVKVMGFQAEESLFLPTASVFSDLTLWL